MTSFAGAMLGFAALALFLFAFSEIREGRFGAALALGALAVVIFSVAAAMD